MDTYRLRVPCFCRVRRETSYMRICPNPFVLDCSVVDDCDLPPFTTITCLQASSGTSPYRDLFNTVTSLLRTVHLVPERPKSI